MAGTVIVTKYSLATGSPATDALSVGEQAYSFSSDKLFIGETSGSDVVARVIGGQVYTDMLDHTAGTLTASSALVVDASSKLDNLNVDNININGNAITSTDSNGNITITPQGSGKVIIDGLSHPTSDGSDGQFLKTDGAGNLTFGTVVSTLSIAADSGSNDTVNTGETITYTGGAGIDTTVSDNVITIAGEDASDSNKGIASFNTASFATSSGDVTIKALGVSNAQLAGSIANAKLANDGITIGSDDTSLGGTITDLNAMTSIDVDNITLDGNTVSTTNANGNLDLAPHGTGSVTVPSGYEGRAGFTADSLVNKTYVDAVANGLDVKKSVRVATAAALAACTYNNGAGTLTGDANGALTVDGVAVAVDNRVLVKDQAAAAQNGFYKVTATGGAGAVFVLTRTPDADAASELTSGAFTFTEEGTANADNGYVLSTDGAVTLGTTSITFEQFSGAGQISAGNGLTKSGNTINAVGTADKITVSADAITIATGYIGQNSITTLGAITTGSWAATDVAVAHGGTGASDASTARTNLGVAIGSDVQAYDAQLADVAGLAVTNGGMIVGDGSNFVLETGATLMTSMGVGTGDSPQFTAVNVGHASDSTLARSSAGVLSIEGNILYHATGTDIPITDGGTGVSSHTGNGYWVSNAGGTALSYITGTQYQHLGFSSTGVPQASGTIDGGTF
tara:strand:+ start:21810 stop:23858 length:2049 start_codon:yes stop_codon:yes gene_type:complete